MTAGDGVSRERLRNGCAPVCACAMGALRYVLAPYLALVRVCVIYLIGLRLLMHFLKLQ